jgi:cation transport regulator ChaC
VTPAPTPAEKPVTPGDAWKKGQAKTNRLEGTSNGFTALPSRLSYESWDVLGADAKRVSKPERELINSVVAELRAAVQEQGLSYVPVFGYLSLRTDNFRELGLKSQSEVKPGEHTVEAELPGWNVGVVASTIYRGTPEHPGVVAGLSPRDEASTAGTLLKVPLERAEELLHGIFHREYFAEDDLDGAKPQAMYRPVLRDVKTADGQTVKALVFITNPDSVKDIDADGKMTAGQLAWFMGASGGFKSNGGTFGGCSFDYWKNSYVGTDQVIREAIELAKYVPSPETIDWLSQNAANDPRAMKALNVCLELFQGAALPISLHAQQKQGQTLERAPVHKPADVLAEVERFLALAK